MAKTLVTAVGSTVALSAGAIALGDYCWRRQTRVRLVELKSYPSQTREQVVVRFDRFQSLPAPVERYFRNVLREDQPVIASATVRQCGEFLVKDSPDEWRPFIADQFFSALRPGFVWDARIRMVWRGTLIWPRADVRDAYVDGRGSMHAILASLIPAVHEEGTPALNEAALQRYLAEAAWFPTALLPRPGLVWTPIDDTHALATLEDGATRVSLQFEFNAKGEIVSCYTPSRFREVNGKYEPTPWGGFFRNYVNRDGMRVPNNSEAYWRIDGVIHPYFKARNVEIHYEFSPLVEQFIRHADVQGVHRAAATDPIARKKFRNYWPRFGAGAVLIVGCCCVLFVERRSGILGIVLRKAQQRSTARDQELILRFVK
jgi:hypothetical protein